MHDLALAIGGSTVEELKQRMTVREFRSWMKYTEKNGSLNYNLRTDAAIARLAVAMTGGKIEAFMPFPKKMEMETGNKDDFMKMFNTIRKVATKNKLRKEIKGGN